ncbi:MAG: metal ABC transporter permease [Leptospirales bacterium]|nr:metal ABC transporter permease [Leptospirales bacterium]
MLTELSIIFPALAAGVLVLAIHVPLGFEVLKRGIIFIDLAIAQLAAMGAFFAMLAFHEWESALAYVFVIQGSAFLCALAGSLFFMYIEKYHREIEEAIIGCVFVLSATLILLVLGQSSHVGDHLKDLLAGQLLFVSWTQIGFLSVMAVLLIFAMYRFRLLFTGKYFYLFFALFVTVSVQVAGIYLVFATLIFPAAGVYYVAQYKNKLLLGYLGSFLGLIGGLLFSFFLDMATGPTLVWSIALSMLAIFCIRSYCFKKIPL